MLNDVWNSLVNEVEATKRCYDELEAAMMALNNHLNDGILALLDQVDKLEDKFHTIHNCFEDVWVTMNNQQHKMYNMDQMISFYSGSVVQLEGKKAEEVKDRFDILEQHIAGQDDQIKILLRCLVAAEEGCCHCWESTLKVISCCCFDVIVTLTADVQETKDKMEAGGLEYEDEEVEAFSCSLIARN